MSPPTASNGFTGDRLREARRWATRSLKHHSMMLHKSDCFFGTHLNLRIKGRNHKKHKRHNIVRLLCFLWFLPFSSLSRGRSRRLLSRAQYLSIRQGGRDENSTRVATDERPSCDFNLVARL